MQTIDRAMAIIRILSASTMEEGRSITELAKQCGLPLGTLHRLLKSLANHGLVEQDEQSKRYSLGTLWLEYGLNMYDKMDYISIIKPELDRLAHEVKESVYLSRPLAVESIIIERINSEDNPIRVHDPLGIRIPMHIGAANKAMLASMAHSKSLSILKQLLPSEEIPALLEQLKQIRKQGYAVSHGERTEGTSSIAVAILNGLGEIAGAISIGLPQHIYDQSNDERLAFLTGSLIKTGKDASAKIGYKGRL
ncbi:MAG: IclR family transcriptional regulator [Bacillus sp. (in: firmicutes)]